MRCSSVLFRSPASSTASKITGDSTLSKGVLNITNRAISSNPDRRFSSGAEKRQMTVFTSAEAKERRD